MDQSEFGTLSLTFENMLSKVLNHGNFCIVAFFNLILFGRAQGPQKCIILPALSTQGVMAPYYNFQGEIIRLLIRNGPKLCCFGLQSKRNQQFRNKICGFFSYATSSPPYITISLHDPLRNMFRHCISIKEIIDLSSSFENLTGILAFSLPAQNLQIAKAIASFAVNLSTKPQFVSTKLSLIRPRKFCSLFS